jgi:IclR family acetate operon transcriptional repressor
MQKLHDRFNETVNLGVLNRGDVLYLDILETSRPFRMMATIGCRMPALRTAMGKAILARLAADQAGSQGLAVAPKLTPIRREALQRELDRTCRHGFAIDNEENEPGVACISAAILDAVGVPIAAISVSGPAYRILAGKKTLAQAIMAACQEISRNLGYIE